MILTKEERKYLLDAVAAIRDLIPETEFGYCYEDDVDLDDMAYDFITALKKVNIPAQVFAGVSKLVIVPAVGDYVIKIPFDGQYDYHYDTEDETEYKTWYPFTKAGRIFSVDDRWDYCEVEVVIYERAIDSEVEDFFVETMQIDEVLGRPIYIQKKALSIEEGGDSGKESSPEAKKNRCYCKPEHEWLEPTWIEAAIDFYGLEKVIDLKNFIDDYCLKDFHNGNVGYTSEGKPVIIDYAGWRD